MRLAEAAQLQRHGIDPYNGAIGKKLILSVVGIHAALIPFLCLLTWFDEEKLKREEVPPITREVIIPIVMNLPDNNAQQKTETPPAGDPQPVKQPKEKERKDLGPLPPIEPLPELPPPPPRQKPKPKPQPQQVKPEPQPQKPKPQPQKPKPQPQKPKPQPQKPKPQPQKPKPQPQKPKQPQQPSIEERIRAQREKNRNNTVTRPRETEAERKAREKAAQEYAARQRAEREAAEKAARARAQALADYKKGLQGVDSSGVDGILADSKDREYLGKLKAFVEPRFRQPSDAQLNGQKPHTIVSVSIASDGRVLDWQITRASGIAAMDDAVRNTMHNLKVVPAPPRAMKIPLTFQAK